MPARVVEAMSNSSWVDQVSAYSASVLERANPAFEAITWLVSNTKNVTRQDLINAFYNFPALYEKWWLRIYQEAPIHIYIETALIVFIIWLMFIRKTGDPKKSQSLRLPPKEAQDLIDTWEPEPLVPVLTQRQEMCNAAAVTIESTGGVYGEKMKVKGYSREITNVSSFDFLGLRNDQSVKDAATAALMKYGCGSCGPRGFYGTIDVHLQFEEEIAEFMGTTQAISYSDSASAIASAITAFAKRGDLILVDEACNESIKTGLTLSRATVQTFKHNNITDLRALLQGIASDDIKKNRDATQQRRFIVTEGLFRSTGETCPLEDLLSLKEQYCYRLILDEGLSFGTLGATGRGITEHFNANIKDVEILLLPMDTTLGSVGGVCVGSREIVDHQRLSGAGYCFSAAAAPFLSSVACKTLSIMKSDPSLLEKLRANAGKLTKGIGAIPGIYLKASNNTINSPVMHFSIDTSIGLSREQERQVLLRLCKNAMDLGVGITTCKLSMVDNSNKRCFTPSVRICATAYMSDTDITKIINNLSEAVNTTLEETEKARRRTRTVSGNGEDEMGILPIKEKRSSLASPIKSFMKATGLTQSSPPR